MRPSRRQMQPFTRRWTAGRPSLTAVLIALHVALFAAQSLVTLLETESWFSQGTLEQWLALTGAGVTEGRVWQFFTFTALHAGPWPLHLATNMLLLYFAGREVELIVGPRHFAALYILGNLVGGAAHWLFMPEFPLVGVSAGVSAIVVAYATILPELEVTMNLFFVLPLRLRAKHLALGLTAATAALWATTSAPEIGPSAMLAGVLVGWVYVKQLGFGNPLAIQRYIFERRQRAHRMERMSAEQFINAEIDPILDKIAREGMHSLTRAERKILEKGREKIAAKTARTTAR